MLLPVMAASEDLANSTDYFTVLGAAIWDRMGGRIATCDANGDGVDDVVIAADLADGVSGARYDSGEAWLVLGQRKRWQGSKPITQLATTRIVGPDMFDSVGRAVACGDLNGDGFDDIVLGAINANGASNDAPATGEAHIIFGRPVWPPSIDLLLGVSTVLYGENRDDNFGDLLSIGDLNADGTDDLVVGAHYGENSTYTGTPGRAYIFSGRNTWPPRLDASTQANVRILGRGALQDFFGDDHTVGDLNQDNIADLVIAAPAGDGQNDSRPDAGEIFILRGRSNWPSVIDLSSDSPDTYIVGPDITDRVGNLRGLAIGDLDGDGNPEIFVGSRWGDGPSENRFDAGEYRGVEINGNLPVTIDLATEYDYVGFAPTIGDGAASWLLVGEIDGHPPRDLAMSVTKGDGPAETRPNSGETIVVYGRPTFPRTADFAAGAADLTIYSKAANELCTLKGLADLNNDGMDEVLVGAWLDSTDVLPEVRIVSPFDSDGDGVRQLADNCPLVANPTQIDSNGDQRGDVCQLDWDGDSINDPLDCAPSNALGGPPGEATNLRFAAGSKSELRWDAAPFGERYEVTRGNPSLFVGSNFGECVTGSDANPTDLSYFDASIPASGEVLSYLISARNIVCALSGTLGLTSSGASRANSNPAGCPY